jgi:hypothetical protein
MLMELGKDLGQTTRRKGLHGFFFLGKDRGNGSFQKTPYSIAP